MSAGTPRRTPAHLFCLGHTSAMFYPMPGEKLFEELYLCGNEINTEDPDILVVPEGDGALSQAEEGLAGVVDRLLEAARNSSPEALRITKSLVQSEYYPHAKANHLKTELPFVQSVTDPRHLEPTEVLN